MNIANNALFILVAMEMVKVN